MSIVFTELFVFDYEGSASALRDELAAIEGVDSVSLGTDYEVLSTELTCDISYDSYATDRTQIAEQIETLDGTGEVIFG